MYKHRKLMSSLLAAATMSHLNLLGFLEQYSRSADCNGIFDDLLTEFWYLNVDTGQGFGAELQTFLLYFCLRLLKLLVAQCPVHKGCCQGGTREGRRLPKIKGLVSEK